MQSQFYCWDLCLCVWCQGGLNLETVWFFFSNNLPYLDKFLKKKFDVRLVDLIMNLIWQTWEETKMLEQLHLAREKKRDGNQYLVDGIFFHLASCFAPN